MIECIKTRGTGRTIRIALSAILEACSNTDKGTVVSDHSDHPGAIRHLQDVIHRVAYVLDIPLFITRSVTLEGHPKLCVSLNMMEVQKRREYIERMHPCHPSCHCAFPSILEAHEIRREFKVEYVGPKRKSKTKKKRKAKKK
jgi:hypothetical protein